MNRFCYLILLLLACQMPTSYARTQFMDGHRLYDGARERLKMMRAEKDVAYELAMLFTGYVMGVVDTAGDLVFCAPAKFNGGYAATIVASYMEKHPEHLSWPPETIVTTALTRAFPCNK